MDNRQWQQLIGALRDIDDIDGAVDAATRLHKGATPDDVPRLLGLLQDDSFFVREAAAWPLSDMGKTDVLPELLVAYQRGFDEGHDNDGFSAALVDLVSANPLESRRELEALSRHARKEIQANAEWLLEFLDEPNDV